MRGELTFTRQDAFVEPVAGMVVDAMCLPLDQHQRFRLQLCLQEAIQNALLHGCLNCNRNVRKWDDFVACQRVLRSRLRWPWIGKRKLRVVWWRQPQRLVVAVQDGNRQRMRQPTATGPFGRGLQIITGLAARWRHWPRYGSFMMIFKDLP